MPPPPSQHSLTDFWSRKMRANYLDNRDTNFSHPTLRQPANGKGRGVVSEPTSPGNRGWEKKRGGKEQDTANWLEGGHAETRVRERHQRSRKPQEVDTKQFAGRRSNCVLVHSEPEAWFITLKGFKGFVLHSILFPLLNPSFSTLKWSHDVPGAGSAPIVRW
jgi:hypothetical protein